MLKQELFQPVKTKCLKQSSSLPTSQQNESTEKLEDCIL